MKRIVEFRLWFDALSIVAIGFRIIATDSFHGTIFGIFESRMNKKKTAIEAIRLLPNIKCFVYIFLSNIFYKQNDFQ